MAKQKQTESEFERDLINYLCNGEVSSPDDTKGILYDGDFPLKLKIWEYKPEIKTTEQLWQNFKQILEHLNEDKLQGKPLSNSEFARVKQQITNQTQTPFAAGKFLYGVNGVSQIEILRDDDTNVFLTVFDQRQIGAGNTVYQVVNQIERPAKIAGKPDRRFDVTLLINGLPIIQIELKANGHDVNESFAQMKQYAQENQFSDIFGTVQILVGMTKHNARYMANTSADQFNTDFAFMWQKRSNNEAVRRWTEFADSMLTIPMAHQMATNYMILDSTTNKQMLKVMRPYQVYATQAVIEGIKKADFDVGKKEVGYVWHTTGSGKTITSFKTAWLASRLPKVDKVVFVVDRIALTNQTFANYSAYDPDKEDASGGVKDTNSTNDLNNKLKRKDGGIIVTSVQKLGNLISRSNFTAPDKNIVFIVDEAHRSTSGDQFRYIKKKFKRSLWVGYTGTPMFEGVSTQETFGELLHAYTIREAIADKNVLGFKVEFKSTVDLVALLKAKYPTWTDEQIQAELEEIRKEEFDEAEFLENNGKSNISKGEQIERQIDRNFYDINQRHVEAVVKDIFDNWVVRSNNYKYNALFTTHVSGKGVSTPLAIRYYNEFQRVNTERRKAGKRPLKVAITYSLNTANNEFMAESNEALHQAINDYNETFGTNWGLDSISEYFEDLSDRLSKKVRLKEANGEIDNPEKAYLDLVIVVDQLLTGFDAPGLNTLYVDRILKGAGLIQAYSRTNRIADLRDKPWGQVVNYRWPVQNERLMNEALAIYANRDSASDLNIDPDYKKQNQDDGIIAKPFPELVELIKPVISESAELTKSSTGNSFSVLPPSESDQEFLLEKVKEISSGISKLKQYPIVELENGEVEGFDPENPLDLIIKAGFENEEEYDRFYSLTQELKVNFARKHDIPLSDVDVILTTVKEVLVNYDYLTDLLNELGQHVQAGENDLADQTEEKIKKFSDTLVDPLYAIKVRSTAAAIRNGSYPGEGKPWKNISVAELQEAIDEANQITRDRRLLNFRNKWGITDIISNKQIEYMAKNHKYGERDLDKNGKALTQIINLGAEEYKSLATDPEVQKYNKIKYLNSLTDAFYKLVDNLVQEL